MGRGVIAAEVVFCTFCALLAVEIFSKMSQSVRLYSLHRLQTIAPLGEIQALCFCRQFEHGRRGGVLVDIVQAVSN